MQPLQAIIFAQESAPPSDDPLEPELDPLLEPLEEPLLDPLLEPLEEPELDPLLEPLEEPLLDPLLEPLEEPLLDPLLDPLEEPLLEPVPPPSSPPNPPPVPVLLDEHAASNPRKLPDAHTNLPIFSIAASSSCCSGPSQSDGRFSSYPTEPPRKRPGSLCFVSFSLTRPSSQSAPLMFATG